MVVDVVDISNLSPFLAIFVDIVSLFNDLGSVIDFVSAWINIFIFFFGSLGFASLSCFYMNGTGGLCPHDKNPRKCPVCNPTPSNPKFYIFDPRNP